MVAVQSLNLGCLALLVSVFKLMNHSVCQDSSRCQQFLQLFCLGVVNGCNITCSQRFVLAKGQAFAHEK